MDSSIDGVKIDQVGHWSEIKLAIIKRYSKAYGTILANQSYIRQEYVDAFAGAGMHVSKETGELIDGSPLIALKTEPPFLHHHFIDLDDARTENLRQQCAGRSDVSIYRGDANEILVEQVLPSIRYENYKRALCIFDPYNLNPNWEVVQMAGTSRAVDMFLNFMIMDANRDILWKNSSAVTPAKISRMNRFWGDDSWREVAYEPNLFGEPMKVDKCNQVMVEAYCKRLKSVGCFDFIAKPLPLKNKQGAVVYYLVFASNNLNGRKIASEIMEKYR